MKNSTFLRLYNFRDEYSTGRCMILLSTFFSGIANVFITGTFYTAFLANNGIDIVNVGIITFIPYFSWTFALFGPKLLQRFKRRRGILLFNHIFYYTCVVLATTVMPDFVSDPGARTVWFAVLLLAGNLSNALIGSGATPWQMNFLPKGKDRNYHFSITNLVTNLTGTVAAVGASALADSLAGSPHQAQIIVTLRMVSFGLFLLCGVFTLIVPKEYPYPITTSNYRMKDIFLQPIRERKFFMTILIAVAWNCIGNFNGGTWSFYMLETLGMKYTMTYISSFVCALGSLFLLPVWRSIINRYGWFRIIFVNVAVTGVLELVYGFVSHDTIWLYVVAAVLSGLNLIGAQITFANVFYVNLPKNDPDIYITFYNFAVYVFIFLGSMFGTWLLAQLEKLCAGSALYGSQLLVWIKCVCYGLLALYIWRITKTVSVPAEEEE